MPLHTSSTFPEELWATAFNELGQPDQACFCTTRILSASARLCAGIDGDGGTQKRMARS
jgi:hypothetical protein